MMQSEFTSRVLKLNPDAHAISDEQWNVINYVYTWHPLIDEVKGKDQVARLYAEFGFGIFKEMEYKANRAEQVEEKIKFYQRQLEDAKKEMEELKEGI